MMRHSRIALVAVAFAAATGSRGQAQSLTDRIAKIDYGSVRFRFASRDGVCGDGRSLIADADHYFFKSGTNEFRGTHDTSMRGRCKEGPVSVTLSVAERRVGSLRTTVGSDAVTQAADVELGVVPVTDAARYLLSVAKGEGGASRDAILALALMDSIKVAPMLMDVARDADRPLRTRQAALEWAGYLGDAAVVRAIDALAMDANADSHIRETAVMSLSQRDDDAGVPTLSRIARGGADFPIRKKAVFWLGQVRDDRGHQVLRDILSRDTTPDEIKYEAMFALSQGDHSDDDVKFLRSLYPKLPSARLRERVFFSLSQIRDPSSVVWMLDVAADPSLDLESRKKAMFWAGQSGEATDALLKLYPRLTDRGIKDQYVFVLSQRQDSEALDKLIDIAKSDKDTEIRKKAIFWLGQSHDPRALRFFTQVLGQ